MRVLAAFLLTLFAVGCAVEHKQCEQQQVRSQYVPPSEVQVKPPCDVLDHHDAYHVIVFSYQNFGWRARVTDCHTYCTWVHTRNKEVVDQVDISWCPRDGANARTATTMVPGKNKCLAETMRDATNHKITYCVLRTDKTFFDAALRQRESLTHYVVLDGNSRPAAVNCIHACSDVAGHLDTGTLHGASAGNAVANFFVRSGKAWSCDDNWVFKTVMTSNNCNVR